MLCGGRRDWSMSSRSPYGPPLSRGVGCFVIVCWSDIFQAKRTNRRHLGDVLTGFRPVEMRRIARQNDNATGWIRLEFIGVELITLADVENAGDNCVNPILRVSVWHNLHAVGYSDPD